MKKKKLSSIRNNLIMDLNSEDSKNNKSKMQNNKKNIC